MKTLRRRLERLNLPRKGPGVIALDFGDSLTIGGKPVDPADFERKYPDARVIDLRPQ